MIHLPGYRLLDKIYESSASFVFRGVRTNDDLPVVLKFLRGDFPSPDKVLHFKQEYRIASMLSQVSGVIGVHGLEDFRNTLVMVLEDFGGQSFDLLTKQQPFGVRHLLMIFSRLTEIIGHIHAADVIHKDINPSNVVYNPSTRVLKVIDFGISSVLSREGSATGRPELLEGTLAYLAPEQTGRMNRSVDYRSDYYSLGATFYELLTGRAPFETAEPLEMVHCHMAKSPSAPHLIDPTVPVGLSNIVLKLLSKNAEDRYQSSSGIRSDLMECLQRLDETGTIESFPLATRDVPERFEISQKLYGRDEALATLKAQLDRARTGGRAILLLSGPAGIGKTALVQEMAKATQRGRYFFAMGKFELFESDVPYSGFIRAFCGLIREILSEPDDRLRDWKERFLSALGTNAQLMSDLMPELEFIIGRQSPPKKVEAEDLRNRSQLAFPAFVSAFCADEHPLILFLDDLQWADAASLAVLQSIVRRPDMRSLLIIGAYRDTEIRPDSPLSHMLAVLQDSCIQTSLSPLRHDDVADLCSDSLYRGILSVAPLADLLMKKTAGNPLHVHEFLKMLYARHLLAPGTEERGWCWDLDKIATVQVPDSVIEIVAEKFSQLDDRAQQILKSAACLGCRFDLREQAMVFGKSEKEIFNSLREAVTEGFVAPVGNGWRFVESEAYQAIPNAPIEFAFCHDRLRQVCYDLIPPSERARTHLHAGRTLLQQTSEGMLDERTFSIVNQFNLARELIEAPSERELVARLDLRAGTRAAETGAYESALSYLTIAVGLLDQDCWTTNRELAWNVYVETARAAYLCSDFQRMEQYCRTALTATTNSLERAQVSEVLIQGATAQYRMNEAIRIGLVQLRELDVHIPERPRTIDAALAMGKTRALLLGKSMANLSALPQMTIPTKLAAMRIMSVMLKPAYGVSLELAAMLALKSVQLSVRYGNAPESPVAYAIYGALLCRAGAIAAGHPFANLSLELAQSPQSTRLQPRTAIVTQFMVRHWKEHYRNSLQPLLQAYRSGLENGNIDDAAYCAYGYCTGLFRVGYELTDLEKIMAFHCDNMRALKHETALRLLEIFHQTVVKLIRSSDTPCALSDAGFREDDTLGVYERAQHRGALCCVYLNQLLLCFLFDDYVAAIRNADSAAEYLDGITGTAGVPIFYFYDSLARLAAYPGPNASDRNSLLRKVKSNQRKLKRWAYHAPMNHHHRFLLVEAERFNAAGRDTRAGSYYDQAISLARENEYIQEAALGNELAARFYYARSRFTIARAYLLEAIYWYQRWGAEAKVKHLSKKYEDLAAAVQVPSTTSATPITLTSISGKVGQALDSAWMLKASQALIGEFMLDRLLSKLMRIVIEHAGADRGYLILEEETGPIIAAEVHADQHGDPVIKSLPVKDSSDLPTKLITYVARTREDIVINDSSRKSGPAFDRGDIGTSPKSVLCAPLVHQGKLAGILYLENRLTTNAFTTDRLEIVRFLCSQAAISLENARSHDRLTNYSRTLEQRVAERTAKLVTTNEQLNNEIVRRKRIEEALRASEERLEIAVDSADIGLWDLNTQTDEGFVNERGAKLFGYELEDLTTQYEMWRTLFHPEDAAEAERLFDLHLEDETPLFECEIRIRDKNGVWRWTLVRGRVVERDEQGRPKRVAGTFMDINDRREAADRIRESLNEKEILIREVHHRVKNNLQIMTSLLRLQARYAGDDAHAGLFRVCEDRVRSMAMVHERLYQSENLASLKADEYLNGLIEHLQGSYGSAFGRVRLSTDIQPVALSIDTAIPLGFIVTELFTNCLKHAFPDRRDGYIRISLASGDADALELVVKDNGVGMNADCSQDIPQSLGLQLVKIFSTQIGAQVQMHGMDGCEFRMVFKDEKRARAGK